MFSGGFHIDPSVCSGDPTCTGNAELFNAAMDRWGADYPSARVFTSDEVPGWETWNDIPQGLRNQLDNPRDAENPGLGSDARTLAIGLVMLQRGMGSTPPPPPTDTDTTVPIIHTTRRTTDSPPTVPPAPPPPPPGDPNTICRSQGTLGDASTPADDYLDGRGPGEQPAFCRGRIREGRPWVEGDTGEGEGTGPPPVVRTDEPEGAGETGTAPTQPEGGTTLRPEIAAEIEKVEIQFEGGYTYVGSYVSDSNLPVSGDNDFPSAGADQNYNTPIDGGWNLGARVIYNVYISEDGSHAVGVGGGVNYVQLRTGNQVYPNAGETGEAIETVASDVIRFLGEALVQYRYQHPGGFSASIIGGLGVGGTFTYGDTDVYDEISEWVDYGELAVGPLIGGCLGYTFESGVGLDGCVNYMHDFMFKRLPLPDTAIPSDRRFNPMDDVLNFNLQIRF